MTRTRTELDRKMHTSGRPPSPLDIARIVIEHDCSIAEAVARLNDERMPPRTHPKVSPWGHSHARIVRCGWCGRRLTIDEPPVLEAYCSEEHAANAQDNSTI